MDARVLKQSVGQRLTPQQIQQAAERLRVAQRGDRRVSDPPEDDTQTPVAPGAVTAVAYGARKGRR